MRRSQYLPRPLRPRYPAPISVLVWVMLAVGWTLQGTTASAQPDPFHRSPTWVEFRAAFERLRLPGLEPFPEGLEARLWNAYQAKGPDYQPRTHHLDSKGVPLYINRLISEASPYLLQHAHNPVNWYSWGPEAFAAAQAEGKVILVSIGYSTCNWCHVMEQDSYEDEALAEVLNRHFLSIKVDREERPDVDKIHMDAAESIPPTAAQAPLSGTPLRARLGHARRRLDPPGNHGLRATRPFSSEPYVGGVQSGVRASPPARLRTLSRGVGSKALERLPGQRSGLSAPHAPPGFEGRPPLHQPAHLRSQPLSPPTRAQSGQLVFLGARSLCGRSSRR